MYACSHVESHKRLHYSISAQSILGTMKSDGGAIKSPRSLLHEFCMSWLVHGTINIGEELSSNIGMLTWGKANACVWMLWLSLQSHNPIRISFTMWSPECAGVIGSTGLVQRSLLPWSASGSKSSPVPGELPCDRWQGTAEPYKVPVCKIPNSQWGTRGEWSRAAASEGVR